LTWEVEECVEDVEPLCISTLNELVWVQLSYLWTKTKNTNTQHTHLLKVRPRKVYMKLHYKFA